jgi:DNA-binding MarR family transcriptional regulator
LAAAEDDLRQVMRLLVRLLVRTSGVLGPHHHGGMQVHLSEVFALSELDGAGGLSQRELGERLGLEKSTVSRLAAGLVERGWLQRERDPANRRLYRLALTPEGETAAGRVARDFHARHLELLAALTPAERDGLLTGLNGLARVAAEFHAPGGAHDHPQADAGSRC